MSQVAADRNLLFGILALQMDFISRDALVDAMNAWVLQKQRPLADLLQERGALAPGDRALLEPLVRRHIDQHGGDPARSLAALSSADRLRDDLASAIPTDPDVQASLAALGPGPHRAGPKDASRDWPATIPPAQRSAAASVGLPSSSGLRFRILRPHARGGLGEVYVARDHELNREVALKQIQHRHADHPESRSRFLLEAEITGGLEHPGIVPVYGLGSDADGRPFYAMRFIKGDSLKDAIERFHKDPAASSDAGARQIELQKLLRRFLDVCNAVAYAHSRGVLHRDIKPGNIMMGPYGETLVVDWGLAKVVGRPDESSPEATLRPQSASGSAETLPGSAIGTPAFMSPEQAEGRLDRLGPASDVYSLGATLYCLLTGRPPVEEPDVGAALARVRHGEFPPPRQVKPDMPRALEAVCLKAMALKREDRYPTPRALADDLERWLADEPVSAWREPTSVRARRWMRRHRNLMTIAVAAIVMGSVGLAYVAVVESEARQKIEDAYVKQSRSRSVAEGRLNLALEAVNAYHNEVSNDILLKHAEFRDLRNKLLQWPLTFYQKIAELPGPENQDPKNLSAIAEMFARLGLTTKEVGTKEKAIECFRKAIDLLEKLHRDDPKNAKTRADIAFNHNQIALCLADLGRFPDAMGEYGTALRIRETLSLEDPKNNITKYGVANVHNNIGNLLERWGRRKEALESLQRALAIRETLVQLEPDSNSFRETLASSYSSIQSLQAGSVKMESARKAVELFEDVARRFPGYREGLIGSLANLGVAQREAGKSADAERSWRRALDLLEPMVRDVPTRADNRNTLSVILRNLSALELGTGRMDEGLKTLQRAAEVLERLIEDDPDIRDHRRSLAWCHLQIGRLLREKGRIDAADRSLTKAQEQYELLLGEAPGESDGLRDLTITLTLIGRDWITIDDDRRAIESCRRAIAILAKLAAAHPEVQEYRQNLASNQNNLGLALWHTKDYRGALEAHRQGVAAYAGVLKTSPTNREAREGLAICQTNVGNVLRSSGDPDAAADAYRQAIATASELVQASPETLLYRITLGRALEDLGSVLRISSRYREARDAYRQAIDHERAAFARDPHVVEYRRLLSESYAGLATCLRSLGEAGEAARITRARKALWDGHPDELYSVACSLALCVPDIKDASQRQVVAAEAVQSLTQAIAAGWWNAPHAGRDPDLASLRDRQDFQRLLGELFDRGFPADPFVH